jgi:uncharacterized protein YfaS (alpha-2-macroglobulin family)
MRSTHPFHRSPVRLFINLILVATAAVLGLSALPHAVVGAPQEGAAVDETAPSWSEVDRLVSEQKFEAAAAEVARLREAARAAGDADEWTRALVEEVKLRTALHGYETSVRFLKDQEWPDDAVSRAVLDLYYANALVTYVHAYSWEIRQRERVASDDEVDLKRWTVEQIAAEAQRALRRVWSARSEWGSAPLGELGRYIEQNNYPPRIRGTLRDAVSYLWVGLLADTSLWRPGQSNDLFKLDLPALIEGDPGASATLDLADPRVHPVSKIGAILDDLEAWHLDERRPEAALEARLERLRRLHSAFESSHDRVSIRQHLEAVQDTFDRSYGWWSMGQSVLAEFLRGENDPDSLVRARDAAIAGADRHPSSVGGQRCRHIVAAIEAPEYSVTAMAADSPNRRSIQIGHRNLSALHLRAWRYDLYRHVESGEDYNLLPQWREVPEIMKGVPAASWSVGLPTTPDYRLHTSYAELPMKEPGAYVVVASARRDFSEDSNQLIAVNVVVGDLVLVTRQLPGAWEISARSGATGWPIADAEVSLYRADWRRGHREVARRKTGIDGIVRFELRELKRESHFLLARWRDHVAVDATYLYPQPDPERGVHSGSFLYTDRTVYRPQQDMHWKVVAYRGGGEAIRYRTQPRTSVTVTLVDANGDEVTSETVKTNDFGSASGSFEVPAGRLLGRWFLRASLGGQTEIRVEEYKRPTFEVTVDDPSSPMRLNRPAALTGEARYYFGLPVVVGDVGWRVTREPVYPRWWWWWGRQPEEPQIVASGDADLDEDGGFEIRFTPEVDEREAETEGMSYNYRLSVDVTDEGGETRSASRVFRLGFVSIEARITSEEQFFIAREQARVSIVRSDLNGSPRPGSGKWRLVRLAQPDRALLPADQPVPVPPDDDRYRTDGDLQRPRWGTDLQYRAVLAQWDDGEQIAKGTLDHGEDGSAAFDLPDLSAGAYRLRYETEDDFGATARTGREFLVAGRRATPVALPALLEVERASVPVGETARLLVRSALRDQELVLEIHRDGRRTERRVLHSRRDVELVEIPISEDLRGGFGVTLTTLRDHQLMRQQASVFVPWDDRQLEVAFATFRDRMRPGTSETFRVTVRGIDEGVVDAGAAELLAYMYDRSLDIFAPHTPPNPLALYPNRTAVGWARTNLGAAQHAWSSSSGFGSLPHYPTLLGDRLKVLDGYGIGGPGRRRFFAAKAMVAEGRMAQQPMPSSVVADEVMAEAEIGGDMDADKRDHGAAPVQPEEAAVELRSDFSETAFFQPHLLLEGDGAASIEFEVPDSVTDWNVWVHAVTTDLRAGSVQRQAASVKELMVRPYLPRFLREGDVATLKVVVNNAGEETLSGALDFEIVDPDTDEDLRALFGLDAGAATRVAFEVEPGAGTNLSFPIKVPARVGTVAFRVTARAGDYSDGELRPLPVLPGRMHLMQSRFVTLRDADRRELRFADMTVDDPSLIHDQLVVTVDAQLFYSVLNALPYLVSYPYECTEQTLNRFLSTGIVSSLYDAYPSVQRMAEEFSARDTRLETWEATDPNRKMALEETPWLVTARGGAEQPEQLINVLDPRIARANRSSALAKLEKAQTSLGAFPWFPGGPPSPYMTLYILYGFSKALEFDVEVPKPMVVRAWSYMHRHYMDELVDLMMSHDCCWEFITYLNFVLSNYPDDSWTGGVFTADDRRQMLDFSFRHWKRHQPLLKGYLALTLERAGRHDDARLVFDSVMDSSKTDQDLGTYWAPEDRGWLWYNDTIETHAFALRTLTELEPDDGRRHGLVQWLLVNKKLNHWKSTRATAEVIYSLVHYLEHEGTLAVREDATVTVGPIRQTFVFEPDSYTGARNRVIVSGPEVDPATMSTVVVEKSSKGFAFASATWHFSTERLPEEARGDLFSVTRAYYRRIMKGDEFVLEPLAEGTRVEPGDQVEVHLSIRAKHAAEYVHLRDPRGAGFEPETLHSRYKWDLGIAWYEEVRDSGTNFFFEWLPAGEYTFRYRLRANMAGTFRVGPATLQSMYAPEFAAYSAGHRLAVAGD